MALRQKYGWSLVFHAKGLSCTSASHGRCALWSISGDRRLAARVRPSESTDSCPIYGTPTQMILLVNGLQWSGYKKMQWGSVGESDCADSWGRAKITGEPSLSIPCYAERRYGGVLEGELLMALPPRYLPNALDGLAPGLCSAPSRLRD